MGIEWGKELGDHIASVEAEDPNDPFLPFLRRTWRENERLTRKFAKHPPSATQLEAERAVARDLVLGESISREVLGQLDDDVTIAQAFEDFTHPRTLESAWAQYWIKAKPYAKAKISRTFNPILRLAMTSPLYLCGVFQVDRVETMGDLRALSETQLRRLPSYARPRAALFTAAVRKYQP